MSDTSSDQAPAQDIAEQATRDANDGETSTTAPTSGAADPDQASDEASGADEGSAAGGTGGGSADVEGDDAGGSGNGTDADDGAAGPAEELDPGDDDLTTTAAVE